MRSISYLIWSHDRFGTYDSLLTLLSICHPANIQPSYVQRPTHRSESCFHVRNWHSVAWAQFLWFNLFRHLDHSSLSRRSRNACSSERWRGSYETSPYKWSVYLIVPPEHYGEEFDNVPATKRQLGTLLRRSLSIGQFLILTRPF